LLVDFGKGTVGDLSAGEGETEVLDDMLAAFDESFEPFPVGSS
jgi:hypothetical protein